MADLLFCDLGDCDLGDLEPELSVKSTISQMKSCVLVTAFDESLFYLLPILLFSCFAWDSLGSHFAELATCSPWQHCTNSLLWDANRGLNALNPRLANLFSNRASNNAILTAS